LLVVAEDRFGLATLDEQPIDAGDPDAGGSGVRTRHSRSHLAMNNDTSHAINLPANSDTIHPSIVMIVRPRAGHGVACHDRLHRCHSLGERPHVGLDLLHADADRLEPLRIVSVMLGGRMAHLGHLGGESADL
jgi:hypothetical protein